MQPSKLFHSTLVSIILLRFVKCETKAPCCLEQNGWTQWGNWSVCSKTCGHGEKTRSRTCHQAPGVACPGDAVLTIECHVSETCPPANGKWSPWEDWGDCTKTCGGGVQQRKRTCNSPPPSNGGSQCTGKEVETQKCNSNGCPVDGGWGPWSDWSGCSSSCGNGQRFRVRSCNNLPTANGGAPCRGRHMEIVSCNKGDCPT